MKARRNSTTLQPHEEWVSLHRACGALGLSREAILKLCMTGDLEGQIRDTFVFIRRATMERYQKRQQAAA